MTIKERFNGNAKIIAIAVPLLGLVGSLLGLGYRVGELSNQVRQTSQQVTDLHGDLQHLSDRIDQLYSDPPHGNVRR